MKMADVFPSNYIKWDDLQGREVPVVIASVTVEKIGTDQKPVIYFQGKQKGLVCNKTNFGRIAYLYGDETDDWTGKEIVLASEFVEYQGKTVKGLRVKPPRQRNPQPVQQQQSNGNYGFEKRDGYELMTQTRATPEKEPAGRAPESASTPVDLNDPIPF